MHGSNHSAQFWFEFANKKAFQKSDSLRFTLTLLQNLESFFDGLQFLSMLVLHMIADCWSPMLFEALMPFRRWLVKLRLYHTDRTLRVINNVLLINNWRSEFSKFELFFDLPTYVNGWTTASIFGLRSQSCCSITAFADFWSLNGNALLIGVYLTHRIFVLC